MTTSVTDLAAPTEVYAAALRGARCTVTVDGREATLPVRRWTAPAGAGDRFLLGHCVGSTIDLGCGPGRLTAELARGGARALGVDVSDEAVHAARARGAPAVQADLFGPLPGEGRWGTALLADGNIGIGGDPALLLARVRWLVAPGGRVVVECGAPGTGVRVASVTLRAGGLVSADFPWAEVGCDALGALAAGAGLVPAGVSRWRRRWVATLTRPVEDGGARWPR
ncbi:MAG TPA: class I SAM-dependent methyltransferase [Pedococcus sp.]